METAKNSRIRCRVCHAFAGRDGYCKSHRPRRYTVRSNYLENNFLSKKKEWYRDSFAAVSDKYPAED